MRYVFGAFLILTLSACGKGSSTDEAGQCKGYIHQALAEDIFPQIQQEAASTGAITLDGKSIQLTPLCAAVIGDGNPGQ